MTRPTFRYPFAGLYPVTSGFGPRDGGFHTGVDFGLPMFTPVLAANDGTVIYAAHEDAAGNTVTISGADGWQSRYHHLDRWTVDVGHVVAAGGLVGYSDNTGASTGPHLHFEIRSDPSTPVDPLPILLADAAPHPPPSTVEIEMPFYKTTDDGKVTYYREARGYLLVIGDDLAAKYLFSGIPLVDLGGGLGAVAWNKTTEDQYRKIGVTP